MKIGMTERDVAIEVDYQIRKHGGDRYSFYPGIIAVTPGSNPDRHIFERNTNAVLSPGTSVAFDYGVFYRGYCSDFGRSVFMGEPLPEALDAYRVITEANRAGMEIMADGTISPAGICDYVKEFITARGWGDYYLWRGLGHCIGLDVHENPWIQPEFTEPIQSNMCFTLEPKVWKPGAFYVRCEDTVVVGPERARSLTKYSYEPTVIPA
jgi:Xaa-Pro aminopeptidase